MAPATVAEPDTRPDNTSDMTKPIKSTPPPIEHPTFYAEISAPRLGELIADAAAFIPTRPASPALAGMWLTVTETGLLEATAFDYEVVFRSQARLTPGTMSAAGKALVPGRLFAAIVKRALGKTGQVTISAGDGQVSIALDGKQHWVKCLVGADAPHVPTLNDDLEPVATLLPGQLERIVEFATVAAGRDDTLPTLTGTRVEIEPNGLITAVSTDRYRLAVHNGVAGIPSHTGKKRDADAVFLIPTRTLVQVAKFCKGKALTVRLDRKKGTDVSFVAPDGSGVRTRLIDGEFPKYRALLPSSYELQYVVEREALIDAVANAEITAEKNTPVRLTFDTDPLTRGLHLLVSGSSTDEASSEAVIPAECVDANGVPVGDDGTEFQIAFNPAYLLDGLKALSGPLVRLSFTTPTKPGVLTSEAAGWPEELDRYLLMPVRTSG